jgi:hypothetical protein
LKKCKSQIANGQSAKVKEWGLHFHAKKKELRNNFCGQKMIEK